MTSRVSDSEGTGELALVPKPACALAFANKRLLGIFLAFRELKFLGLSLSIFYGGETESQSREDILKVT